MPKTYKEWYEANRVEVNARRRQRYASDDSFREKEKSRTREYKKRVRDLNPHRFHNGEPVYSITKVGRLLGVRSSFIRGMEHRGLLPKPTAPGSIRYYLRRQIVAMGPLVEHWVANSKRSRSREVAADTEDLKLYCHKQWETDDV